MPNCDRVWRLTKRNSRNAGEPRDVSAQQERQQFFEGLFPFADHNHVGPGGQVFGGIVRRIRATDDDSCASGFRGGYHAERVPLRHQIDGQTDHRRTRVAKQRLEVGQLPKRAVEYPNVDATRLQMRGEVQKTERRMRPHDALLFGILREKESVGQQHVHYDTCCGGRINSTNAFSIGNAYQSRSQRQREAARRGHRQRPGCHTCRA